MRFVENLSVSHTGKELKFCLNEFIPILANSSFIIKWLNPHTVMFTPITSATARIGLGGMRLILSLIYVLAWLSGKINCCQDRCVTNIIKEMVVKNRVIP